MKNLMFILLALLSFSAFGAELTYTWSEATQREDGSPITGEKLYHLVVHRDGVELASTATSETSYTIGDIRPGLYMATVSTSEDGLMGAASDPVMTNIETISPPARVTIEVLFSCDGCNLEILQ